MVFKGLQSELEILFRHLNTLGTIVLIEPLIFIGSPTGSEFETYAATKVYLCLSFTQGGSAIQTARSFTSFYDRANNVHYSLFNDDYQPYWNGTTEVVKAIANHAELKNFWFSRTTKTGITLMKFIGYRLTYS